MRWAGRECFGGICTTVRRSIDDKAPRSGIAGAKEVKGKRRATARASHGGTDPATRYLNNASLSIPPIAAYATAGCGSFKPRTLRAFGATIRHWSLSSTRIMATTAIFAFFGFQSQQAGIELRRWQRAVGSILRRASAARRARRHSPARERSPAIPMLLSVRISRQNAVDITPRFGGRLKVNAFDR